MNKKKTKKIVPGTVLLRTKKVEDYRLQSVRKLRNPAERVPPDSWSLYLTSCLGGIMRLVNTAKPKYPPHYSSPDFGEESGGTKLLAGLLDQASA